MKTTEIKYNQEYLINQDYILETSNPYLIINITEQHEEIYFFEAIVVVKEFSSPLLLNISIVPSQSIYNDIDGLHYARLPDENLFYSGIANKTERIFSMDPTSFNGQMAIVIHSENLTFVPEILLNIQYEYLVLEESIVTAPDFLISDWYQKLENYLLPSFIAILLMAFKELLSKDEKKDIEIFFNNPMLGPQLKNNTNQNMSFSEYGVCKKNKKLLLCVKQFLQHEELKAHSSRNFTTFFIDLPSDSKFSFNVEKMDARFYFVLDNKKYYSKVFLINELKIENGKLKKVSYGNIDNL